MNHGIDKWNDSITLIKGYNPCQTEMRTVPSIPDGVDIHIHDIRQIKSILPIPIGLYFSYKTIGNVKLNKHFAMECNGIRSDLFKLVYDIPQEYSLI